MNYLTKNVQLRSHHETPSAGRDLLIMVIYEGSDRPVMVSGEFIPQSIKLWRHTGGDPILGRVAGWSYAPIVTMEELACL